MILNDGMLLYHGSYMEIADIDLKRCKAGLDFGRGFYVTTDYRQAIDYVPSAVRKAIRTMAVDKHFDVNDGQISIYKYREDKELKIHCFPDADVDWLHFVAANRDSDLFSELITKFEDVDIVCGKIANDQTARTLQAYIAGAYGTPGDKQADETAIKMLLPNRLENQICFRSDEAIKALKLLRSVRYGDEENTNNG